MGKLLTLDVGTTSVKVCLFDERLRLAASASREYSVKAEGSRVEAEPGAYLAAIAACVRALPGREDVAAVCASTQGETLIPVDENGGPLGPAVVWLDARAGRQARTLSQAIAPDRFYRATGLPELTGALPLCKLLWFREERPELWSRAAKFLLLEDYLLLWLTGRFATEKSLLTSTGYFCLETDDYWDEGLRAAGLDRSKLPPAHACGETLGALLPARARELGLPERAVVVTGAMDQTAAALAAGCTAPGTVSETTGTAMVAAAYTASPVFREGHRVTIYRHAVPGAFLYLPISNTAGMSLRWFRDTFCPDLAEGPEAYAALDRMAAASRPGAGGLLFLPYLAGAVDPVTEPDATGCFFGVRLSSSRGDFVRAVLEATAYQLRAFLGMLEELGCPADCVTSLGGGSRSPFWLQLKADVCRKPFYTLSVSEATSLGAAMLAAQALGYPTGRPERQAACLPDRDAENIYHVGYGRFCALFEAVRPLYGKDDGV